MAKMLENREQWLIYLVQFGRDRSVLRKLLHSNLSELISHQIQLCDQQIPFEVKKRLPELARLQALNLLTNRFKTSQHGPVMI